LFAGAPRCAPVAALRPSRTSAAEPPGLARHRRTSSVPTGGAGSSRCRFRRRATRLFTVKASALHVPARHGELRLRSPRWPPTSCAHRLRKPDPDERTSDAPCRTADRRARAPRLASRVLTSSHPTDQSLGPDPSSSTTRTPPRQARPRRPRVRRTTTFGPGRLPSVWPSPRSDGGLGRAPFDIRTPRPAPVRLPRAAHAPPKDVWVASDYPAPYPLTTARAPRREGRWTEKMRRPDVCNRSPTRAPIELSDSLSPL
jgi:hypothetical protein